MQAPAHGRGDAPMTASPTSLQEKGHERSDR